MSLVTKGRLKKVVRAYRRVLDVEPHNHGARLKVARALRLLGRRGESIEEYSRLAHHLANGGDLLGAISACKSILEIDAQHTNTQQKLATLYALTAPAAGALVATPLPPPGIATPVEGHVVVPRTVQPNWAEEPDDADATLPNDEHRWTEPAERSSEELDVSEIEFLDEEGVRRPELHPDAVVSDSDLTDSHESLPVIELGDMDFEVIEAELDSQDEVDTTGFGDGWDRIAERLAAETDAKLVEAVSHPMMQAQSSDPSGTSPPGAAALPEIPLLSSLSGESFVRLVERMERRRLAPGEVLVKAGEGADVIHIVVRGTLRAARLGEDQQPVVLAHLHPGDFLGEFTYLTGVPSDVSITAVPESEVFRISDAVMKEIISEYPEVEDVLWRFFEDRMVHSLLATSSLFQGLDPKRQLEIGRRFRALKIPRDSLVLEERKPADGLYLVATGAVEVSAGEGEDRRKIALLRAGEFFGVNAAASGALPVARITTVEDSVLLVLPAEDFRSLLEEEPSMRIAVETVSGMRRLLTDALFHGHTAYADSGLVSF